MCDRCSARRQNFRSTVVNHMYPSTSLPLAPLVGVLRSPLRMAPSRNPVVFVGFRDHISLSMITLDTSGLLCVWPYSADGFSGFGWYVPSQVGSNAFVLQGADVSYVSRRGDVSRGKNERGIGRFPGS